MPHDIRGTIREFISNNFLPGAENFAYTDDDSFLEKGIVDSTGILELVAFVEETWDFRMNDEELIPGNLDSVNRLTAFVVRRRGETRRTKAV